MMLPLKYFRTATSRKLLVVSGPSDGFWKPQTRPKNLLLLTLFLTLPIILTECLIMSLYRKILVTENLYLSIFYTIWTWLKIYFTDATFLGYTAWKVSKYGVISGPYFPVFGLNTAIYSVTVRIQSKYRNMWTRDNSVFGHLFTECNIKKSFLIRWHSPTFVYTRPHSYWFGARNFMISLKKTCLLRNYFHFFRNHGNKDSTMFLVIFQERN